MNVIPTALPEVLLLEPRVFEDARGFFFESYNQRVFEERTGLAPRFVQSNHSRSRKDVLRGLHYQIAQPQGKLVRVVAGAVFDVAVDLRRSSPTFGKWAGEILSADNRRLAWIPAGFAHGFLVLSESADIPLRHDRLLRSGARALRHLERLRNRNRVAAGRRTGADRQGPRRAAAAGRGNVSLRRTQIQPRNGTNAKSKVTKGTQRKICESSTTLQIRVKTLPFFAAFASLR